MDDDELFEVEVLARARVVAVLLVAFSSAFMLGVIWKLCL
jgi:hypothetical protein